MPADWHGGERLLRLREPHSMANRPGQGGGGQSNGGSRPSAAQAQVQVHAAEQYLLHRCRLDCQQVLFVAVRT